MVMISFHILGEQQMNATKLGIHVWDLKKLLISRVQSVSTPMWKQCYNGKQTDA